MPASPNGPVRRAQLVTPFGVGSLVVVPGGTSLVVAGLDYWYQQFDAKRKVDTQEFEFNEWRLQSVLNVDHFRLPPDFREPKMGQQVPNIGLTVPAFRFPTWHFCSDCRLLFQWPLHTKGTKGRVKCPRCEKNKKTRYMFQVPFVAICSEGHLQDFPFCEWIHHKVRTTCDGDLELHSTGSSSLGGQKVVCSCGADRTLAGITNASPDGSTTLSKTLQEGIEFLCQGFQPWLGPGVQQNCSSYLKGSLRSSSNFYYSHIVSSIFLPKSEDTTLQKIEILLQSPPLSTFINTIKGLGQCDPATITSALLRNYFRLLSDFPESQIKQAIAGLDTIGTPIGQPFAPLDEDPRTSFRRVEFLALITQRDDDFLRIRQFSLSQYDPEISKYFDRIMLVSKLTETRAFTGFSRIFPENMLNHQQRQAMLWKDVPSHNRWLPAHKVFGEGIFFEFNEQLLSAWEKRPETINRIKPLADRNAVLQTTKHLEERVITPRFVLLHSFAHLIMNRLTFECGYSSAALRERLFISNSRQAPMGGVLIYTADGDSEGTMGGLVRMGKPSLLEPVIQRALEAAHWCSADPVCMEMGHMHGQGPDSCNLAACHNCALVPETACEEFNRFLDRAVVIGEMLDPTIGFFNL
jgi:hypothetical protein